MPQGKKSRSRGSFNKRTRRSRDQRAIQALLAHQRALPDTVVSAHCVLDALAALVTIVKHENISSMAVEGWRGNRRDSGLPVTDLAGIIDAAVASRTEFPPKE
jgi:hypothetical protein